MDSFYGRPENLSGIMRDNLCDMWLHFRDRRNASLRYRNRAEITVLMCEQKLYPVWLSRRCKSFPVYCEQSPIGKARKNARWIVNLTAFRGKWNCLI